jgi:large subunit ribosomal protein L34
VDCLWITGCLPLPPLTTACRRAHGAMTWPGWQAGIRPTWQALALLLHFRTLSTRGSETATKGHNIVVGSLLQWVWRKSRLDCWSRPPGLAFPRRDSIRGGGPQQDKLTGPADRVIAVRAAPRGLRVYSPAEERGPIKRTYQPKKKYRRRVHGFLRRMNTAAGVRLIRNRRRKGRHRLTPG